MMEYSVYMKKSIKEGLDHENVRGITIKYHSNYRKHKYKLDGNSRKQCN